MKQIDLNDLKTIEDLAATFKDMQTPAAQEFVKSAETFAPHINSLSSKDMKDVVHRLHITENLDPVKMNECLEGDDFFILHKRYLKTFITKSKFESILTEVVFELARVMSTDILLSIVQLIKSFSVICLESESINTTFKEVCFKFITKDEDNDVLVLVISLDYKEQQTFVNCIHKLFSWHCTGVNLSFFGAVVKCPLLIRA